MLGENDLLRIALVGAREEAHFNMVVSERRWNFVAADSCCSNSEIFERLLASRKMLSAPAGERLGWLSKRVTWLGPILGLSSVIYKHIFVFRDEEVSA
jgi:hypothetical protein